MSFDLKTNSSPITAREAGESSGTAGGTISPRNRKRIKKWPLLMMKPMK